MNYHCRKYRKVWYTIKILNIHKKQLVKITLDILYH